MGLDMYLYATNSFNAQQDAAIHAKIVKAAVPSVGWVSGNSRYYAQYDKAEAAVANQILRAVKIKSNEGVEVTTEGDKVEVKATVAYWRKANSIHRWFVEKIQKGVDDCGYYPVTLQDMEALLKDCMEVKKHGDKAYSLLPTQGGCFFGSTDYGYEYQEDIDLTIKQIKAILANKNLKKQPWTFHYHSSW